MASGELSLTWIEWTLKWTNRFLTFGAMTVLMLGTLLYRYQRKLLYPSHFPLDSRTNVDAPSKWGMKDYENVYLSSKYDKTKLHCYLIWNKKVDASQYADRTILFLHANAGNMGHRLPFAKIFVKNFNANVFMLSYRGYGLSEGEAEETGIKQDAETALEFIKNHPKLKHTKLFVYGQSIGAAVAIDLSSKFEKQIDALIIENTFLSIPKIVPHVFPALKYLTILCTQIWNSEKSIQRILNIPVLFLSGSKDELVPPKHMRQLFHVLAKARNEHQMDKTKALSASDFETPKSLSSLKIWWEMFEHGTHNDTCLQPGYFDAIAKFLESLF